MLDQIFYRYGEENVMIEIMLEKQQIFQEQQSNSPTPDTGASNIPPIGDSLMDLETRRNNYGQNVFVIFKGTDIIQISKITVYYIRFSTGKIISMTRFRIQTLLPNGQWHSK